MPATGPITLTDAKLKALKPPAEGRVEIPDDKVIGLRVRISCKGGKSFILRKRSGAKVHNLTLGTYGPRFGIADARKKARALLSDLEAGQAPPIANARLQATSGTFRALLPAYLDSKIDLRSHREIKRVLEFYVLPALGDRYADSITRGEVSALVDQIAATAPTMARAVHAQLSAFYTWAMPRLDRMVANPCRDAGRPAKAKARDRVLANAELAALWTVANGEGLPWGPGLKLLMLTGARRDEVFNADRSEFDIPGREWVIPAARAKNGQPHIIPLSDAALEVIKAIPALDESAKLFAARGNLENGPSGFSKALARFRSGVDEQLGRDAGEHWTLHDIRRTVATGLQRLGIRFEVTEAVLNHISGAKGGVAGVYQRHDWKAEKRAALEVWATELGRIVKGTNRQNVVAIRG